MDPFVIVVVGGLVAFVGFVLLLGRFYPGSGLEQVGLRSAREITETREALETEDLEQMLAAHNARRRARGEDEVTVEDLEQRVMRSDMERRRRRDEYLADRALDQVLETTNARRPKRGLPERTPEQARRDPDGRPEQGA